jgi:IS30 family transposase
VAQPIGANCTSAAAGTASHLIDKQLASDVNAPCENTNGLLRQYFPKGADLTGYTQRDLDAIVRELNGRPRQTLGWRKPYEVFAQAVATTA